MIRQKVIELTELNHNIGLSIFIALRNRVMKINI